VKGKTKDGPADPKRLKTSLSLPADLWTEARIRALREGIDAQDLVARALEAYLRTKGGAK
jgi:hypothetical protein